ncbi:MAG: DUF481 domain-containing protein [Hydrogenothermaceae bacterium]|nr:DUF481 domain-containing protein [Hydrogenothermaceae bacterium]
MRKSFFVFLFLMPLVSFSQETVKANRFSISIGFIQNKGNIDNMSFNFKFNQKYMEDGYRVETSLTALYGESRDSKISERVNLANRIEYRLKPYFLFWDTQYYRNPFQTFEHSVGAGPGIGRYIYDEKSLYITVGYYISGVYNKLNKKSHFTGDYEENYILHNVETRFSIKFADNLRFTNKSIYKVSSRSEEDYFLVFENSIINKITGGLALEISYNAYYHNIPTSWRVRKWDTNLSTLIQFNF